MYDYINTLSTRWAKLLQEKMLANADIERNKKTHEFNLDCDNIRSELIFILEKYLAFRTSKYDISSRIRRYGPTFARFNLHVAHNHIDFFSNKKSDLYSLEIYENCLDLINQVTDFNNAQEVLEHLSSLHKIAIKISFNQGKHIDQLIIRLKSKIDSCKSFSEQDMVDKKFVIIRDIVEPLEKILLNLIVILNKRIHQKYDEILDKYPTASNCVRLFESIHKVEDLIRTIKPHIFKSVEEAIYCYVDTHESWNYAPNPDDKRVKLEGEKLYQTGLKYQLNLHELEKEKMQYEINVDNYKAVFPTTELDLLKKITKINYHANLENIVFAINVANIGYWSYLERHKEFYLGTLTLNCIPLFIPSLGNANLSPVALSKNLSYLQINDIFSCDVLGCFTSSEMEEIENEIAVLYEDNAFSNKNNSIAPLPINDEAMATTNRRRKGLFGYSHEIELPKFVPIIDIPEFKL